jgi:phosphatidylserine decarboxylase
VSLFSTIKDVMMVSVHPKGQPIIVAIVVLSLVLYLFSSFFGYWGMVFALYSVYFFRDPNRMIPQGEGFVLASGDGVISAITADDLPSELGITQTEPYVRISIFLNVFNVHVNRIPASGLLLREVYIPGKFLNASLDKASKDNERSVAAVKTANGTIIGFSQIAGLVARRIVCQLDEGEPVLQGKRYGIIRFGSRCDVYVPARYTMMVNVGTVAVGGETILAVDPDMFDPTRLTWQKD